MKQRLLQVGLIFLLCGLLIASIVFAGESWDGKCPICKAEGKLSTVSVGMCMTTAMFCGNGYYDEQGNFHAPEQCNSTTCEYTCSNGHHFSEGMKGL
jgi:hypothetical protein